MRKLILLAMLLLLRVPGWAQASCEISNTGADSGFATINATEGMGYSAPGGIGAVGFRIAVACTTQNVAYHVWRVDTSPASAPTTYDIGLYCVSGECMASGYGGELYLHTGPIYGSWFTNNLIPATVTGVTVTGSQNSLTLNGYFLLPDFPIGEQITLGNCGVYNVKVAVNSAGKTVITTTNPTGKSTTAANCTILTSATYPTSFTSHNPCVNTSMVRECQQALPWIADSRTVCASIPCTLPAGLYAAAIGTTCNDGMKQVACAQLLGDDDFGLIYPFTSSSTQYDSGGLPANMSFTVNNTTAVWNTTQSSASPIKPAKLLIY